MSPGDFSRVTTEKDQLEFGQERIKGEKTSTLATVSCQISKASLGIVFHVVPSLLLNFQHGLQSF